ncbi:MAG: hypothetical protein WCB05_22145 [Candidatus Sulfotelmatobacter sp.]
MASYPNRCQHLKINGTQCGSPALRRNRLCFFHKRFQDERIKLALDRKRAPATFILPVLEDANSIQIALMQVMRLLLSQQIEHKTASLLLYALQTAGANLRMTNFKPMCHEVILDPRDAAHTLLGESLWEDEDFEEEEDEEEESPKLDPAEALYAKMREDRFENARQRGESEERLKMWAANHPEVQLVRDEDDRLRTRYKEGPASPSQPLAPPQPAAKKPAGTSRPEQIGAQIANMVRKSGLVEKYGSAVQPNPQPEKRPSGEADHH